MKKILALLTALVLALSCTLALAEEAEAFPGLTITSEVTIDGEQVKTLLNGFGVEEKNNEIIDAVVNILNALASKLSIAADGVQLDLNLNGADVLAIAGQMTEEGLSIGSNLIPSYVLKVSKETLDALVSQVGGEEADADGIAEAMQNVTDLSSAYAEKIMELFMGVISFGEPETGDYSFNDDVTFNTCIPIVVDLPALHEGLNAILADAQADEALQAALKSLEQYGVKADDGVYNVDEIFESITAINCNYYFEADESGNPTGANWVSVGIVGTDENGNANLDFLVDENGFQMDFSIPATKLNATLAVLPREDGVDLGLGVDFDGFYVGISCAIDMGDTMTIASDLYVMNTDSPLASEVVTITEGGEITLSLDEEGKTILAVEDLMNDSEGEHSTGLVMDFLFNGMGSTLSAAAEAMPDEVNKLTEMFGSMTGNAA